MTGRQANREPESCQGLLLRIRAIGNINNENPYTHNGSFGGLLRWFVSAPEMSAPEAVGLGAYSPEDENSDPAESPPSRPSCNESAW